MLLLAPPARRQQLNASLAASGGGKLSLNDFVVKVRSVPGVLRECHASG